MIEDIILIKLGRVFNMCHELEKFSMFSRLRLDVNVSVNLFRCKKLQAQSVLLFFEIFSRLERVTGTRMIRTRRRVCSYIH